MNENHMEKRAYVFGMVFWLSNRLQILGDKMDPLLTVKQWFLIIGVLKCASETPTLSEVAAQIGSSRQNVKKIAAILEGKGFVLMEKDMEDARVLRIHLTDTCAAHLKQRDTMERNFLNDLFNGIEPEELSLLSGSLQKLRANLIEMEKRHEELESSKLIQQTIEEAS